MGFNVAPSANSGKLSMSNFLSENTSSVTRKIPLNMVTAWYNQPFKQYDDERLEILAQSIKENGLLSPITVRPITNRLIDDVSEQLNISNDDNEIEQLIQRIDYYKANIGKYEILSGHNRVSACNKLQWTEITAIVRDNIDDAQAQLIMVDANLQQRHKLLPSELALAYRTQRDALEAIGVRRATSDIADRYQINRKTVQRYVSCSNLIDDMLQMLDDERFTLVAGVALSSLTRDNQIVLAAWLKQHPDKIIKPEMAAKLCSTARLLNPANFDDEDLDRILLVQKQPKASASASAVKLKRKEVTDIIGDDFTNEEIAEFFYFCLQRSNLFDEWYQLHSAE